MTLIELMVSLAIAAILTMAAAPSFKDYLANSRLRENGNVIYMQMLFAQSEAIKRNTTVRVSVDDGGGRGDRPQRPRQPGGAEDAPT